jgi:hypothetical protein
MPKKFISVFGGILYVLPMNILPRQDKKVKKRDTMLARLAAQNPGQIFDVELHSTLVLSEETPSIPHISFVGFAQAK